jgi:hypothetical protein
LADSNALLDKMATRQRRLFAPIAPVLGQRVRAEHVRAASRGRRIFSTSATHERSFGGGTPASWKQLWRQAVASAVPMVGFGFMDNTIMIHAGEYLDNTVGVTFGLSTLTAAAMGQVMSDFSGVLFGGTVGELAAKCGLPDPKLTEFQLRTRAVRWVSVGGAAVGVLIGCTLGMSSLLFMDLDRADREKRAKQVRVQTLTQPPLRVRGWAAAGGGQPGGALQELPLLDGGGPGLARALGAWE